MNMTKTTISAALALAVAAPVTANAGEGPFEINGKNVFEANRDSQYTSSQTLDTRSGILFDSHAYRENGTFTSDQPYEINGKSIFEHNREQRAKKLADRVNADRKAVATTTKKPSWFQRHFRSVRSNES